MISFFMMEHRSHKPARETCSVPYFAEAEKASVVVEPKKKKLGRVCLISLSRMINDESRLAKSCIFLTIVSIIAVI